MGWRSTVVLLLFAAAINVSAIDSGPTCHDKSDGFYALRSCSSVFYSCQYGNVMTLHCPAPQFFNEESGFCEHDCSVTPVHVADEVTHCRHNEMDEIMACTRLFKICKHGQFEAAECPEGYVFKNSARMCVPEKECGVPERVAHEVTHCRHNEMEEVIECNQLFKICRHGRFEAAECPEGYVFKSSERMCVPEKECGVLERVADEVTHCRHNEMEEIMACTRLFKICKHGQFEAAECPEGYVFKKSARMCVPEKECGVPERVAHEATLCRHNETEEMIECAQLFKIGVIPDHFAVSDDIRPIRSPLHTDQGAILDHFAVPGDTKPIRSPLHTDQGAILDHFAVPDDTKPIRSPLHTDQGAILDHFAVPDDTKPIRSPLHTDQGAILDHFAVPDDTKPIRSPLHTDQAAIRDHFAVPDDIEPITSPFPRFSDTPRYITDSFAIKWEVTNDSGKRSKRSLSMTDCSQWPSDSIVYDCMTFYHACVNGKVVRRSCPIGYFLEPRTITCMPTDPRNGCVKLNPPHEVFTKKDAPVVSDVNNTASAEYTKNTTENSNKTVESLSNVQKHEIGEVVPSEAPSTDVSANVTGESNSTSLESSLPPATKVSTAPTTDSHPRTCINNKLIEGQGRPLKACGHHYLICRQGKVHLLRCPGTQVFVESENTCISRWMRKECEWDTISKENADVEEGSVSIPSKSSGETASEDDYSSPTETPVLESGLPVSSSGGGMINLSPCSNRVDGFYRHPTNCSGIIQCFGGVAFHHPSCYADLVFNEKTGSCMLPKSDDNCAKIRRERVEKVAKATTDDTIRTCTDDQHGEFLRHESECNLYYRCVWGQAQLMDCPKGTVFNIDLGVCDYPNNAGLEMLLFLLLCVGTCAINIREEEIEYLERFGYIDNSGPAAQRTEQFLKERIREFQEMAALPMTGEMDDATRRMMRTPRCGRKDHVAKDRFRRHHRSRRRARYTAKWPKTDLTFWLKNTPRSVPDRDRLRREITAAFRAWQDVSALRFSETKSVHGRDVDIAISFERGAHGDAYTFKGPEDPVLAHAFPYYAYSGIGGDVHFNGDKNFQVDPVSANRNARFSEIIFRPIAMHEIGHSLGLEHSYDKESIMFAYYEHDRGEPRLSTRDIYDIQSIYGRNTDPNIGQEAHKESTATTTTTTTTEAPRWQIPVADEGNQEMVLPDPCSARIGAATVIRNELFMFQDAWFWRFHGGKLHGRPTLISSFYEDLPYPVDAAMEIDDQVFFFVGKQVHIYHERRKVGVQPLKALGLPASLQKVRLAYRWKFGNQINYYIWAEDEYWKLDLASMEVELDYPRKVDTFWRGVPEDASAAFDSKEGLFFVAKDKIYKFDGVKAKTSPPTPLILHFEHCKSQPYTHRIVKSSYSSQTADSNSSNGYLIALLLLVGLCSGHRHAKKIRRRANENERWDRTDLTYWVLNAPTSIPDVRTVRHEIAQAFKLWSDVSRLSFREANSPAEADIVLSFEERDHGDGNPFYADDLGHAFMPGSHELNGKVHFNNDYNFQVEPVSEERFRKFSEYHLRTVAAHHIGHALGVRHVEDKMAIMSPKYKHSEQNPRLSQEDIVAIQALYGRNEPMPRSRRHLSEESDESLNHVLFSL